MRNSTDITPSKKLQINDCALLTGYCIQSTDIINTGSTCTVYLGVAGIIQSEKNKSSDIIKTHNKLPSNYKLLTDASFITSSEPAMLHGRPKPSTTSISRLLQTALRVSTETSANIPPPLIFQTIVKKIDSQSLYEKEREFLFDLRCEPSILRLYGFSDRHRILYTQYCEGGDLFDWFTAEIVRKKKRLSESQIHHILQQVVTAIQKCHSKQIVHSDIKLENIGLLKKNDLNTIILLDFGGAVYTSTYNEHKPCLQQITPSPQNLPPELCASISTVRKQSSSRHTKKKHSSSNVPDYSRHITKSNLKYIDYWEIGILAYVLVSHHFPDIVSSRKNCFMGRFQSRYRSRTKMCRLLWENNSKVQVSSECKEFITDLLQLNPLHRTNLDNVDTTKPLWKLQSEVL